MHKNIVIMASLRKILKFSPIRRSYQTSCRLASKPITGYESADNALKTVTGGRVYRWIDAYEDFVGLTEVKNAQEQVRLAEESYRQAQSERRSAQNLLTAVQAKIKTVAMDIEKTQRGTDAYLKLVTRENEIIKEEKDYLEQMTVLDDMEKHMFAELSSALRESHEKERARAERTKYWGILGSIIGAVIGIIGTSLNNYLRMRELKRIVTSATESNQGLREKTLELYVKVNDQYGKIYQLLSDLRSAAGLKYSKEVGEDAVGPAETADSKQATQEAQIENVITSLKQHEEKLELEIQRLGRALSVKPCIDKEDNKCVVYIGPEIEGILRDSEQKLEWKMKVQAVVTVVAIYGVGAIVGPVLWKIFGSS